MVSRMRSLTAHVLFTASRIARAALILGITAATPSCADMADPVAPEVAGVDSGAEDPKGASDADRDRALRWMLEVPRGRAHTQPSGPMDAGLLLDRGVYRPLPDVPGALETTHLRNNDSGQTSGSYAVEEDGTIRVLGFLMQDEEVTTIDVPGALLVSALGINDRGQVVGAWSPPDAILDPVTGEFEPIHGFVWEAGCATTFDVPDAALTAAYEIDNRGQIVGNYTDADGFQHGFVLHDGVITTIDHPRATSQPNMTRTRVVGIDDRGRLVGSYGDDTGLLHAWMWEDGEFTSIDPPGAIGAEASQIDDRGRIVGRYVDATPKLRGFLLDRGHFTPIDVPGRCDTAPFGINDRGQILILPTGSDGSTCSPESAPRETTRN
jgi:hypothetical protein